MGVRTGRPKGRPKGSPNKATAARQAEVEASGLTPLDYLLSILRDEDAEQNVRIDVAKAAAPYVHPRLATVDLGNKDDKPFATEARWADSPSEATPDPSNPS
jgi:hypothetical protein